MAHVYLHGDLQSFGGPFAFDVNSTAEAVRALCSQLKGFRKRLSEGNFRVIRRGAFGGRDLTLVSLTARLKSTHDLHIIPVVAGSGRGKGVGKAILGVALVAASFAFAPAVVGAVGPTLGMGTTAFSIAGFGVTFSQIAGFGASMILGGISQLLSPSPKTNGGGALSGQPTNASFLFSGPVNVTSQGSPVPLVYGRFICGSVVISSAIATENI